MKWASSSCIRWPNIRHGRPRRPLSPRRSNWLTLRPAKAAMSGFPIPTASSNAISRRKLRRCTPPASSMRGIDFTAINWIHVPVALLSILLVAAMLARDLWRRRLDDLTLLAATVFLALLGNAFVCGVISGPHDRYGARMAWVATFAVLIAALRHFADDDGSRDSRSAVTENPARRSCRPCRRPPACDRGWGCRARQRRE